MKTIKICLSGLIIFLLICKTSYSQEWESANFGYRGNSINFLNANTGFIGLKINNGQNWAIYKTNNKGVSFSQIWSTPVTTDNSKGFGFDMINESIGYVFIKSTLFPAVVGVPKSFKM